MQVLNCCYCSLIKSNHNKIKRRLMYGVFRRLPRKCDPQHQDEGFKYIGHSVKSLKYLKSFHINREKQALNIHSSNNLKKNTPTIPVTHRPKPTIQTTSRTIKDLSNISKCTNNATTCHEVIYSIPWKDCDKH